MRAIWTGSIGFGLVNIPVKMFSAVQASELDLDMLDKKDHANIKFQRVNANSGKVVPYENIIKGYKVEGQYIILDDEDFARASADKSKVIEIDQFVEEKEIDTIYYETPYYLEPEKSGVRPYALLRDALKKSGKAGLGTYVMRTKQSLGLIKVINNALVLQKIRFAEEIRAMEDLNIPTSNSKPAELKMALSLINQLTKKFEIDKYKDTYTEQLLKLIKAKSKGKKFTAPAMRVVHSKSKDLMEQLKASLETKRKAS